MYNDKPYFVDKVFDKAPTEKLDKTIAELQKQIADYTGKRNDIQKEVSELQRSRDEKIKLFKSFNDKGLNVLENILNKTLTHFVWVQYGEIYIETIKEIKECGYSYKMNLVFELNSFGSVNMVEYNLYCSRDRSSYKLFPCKNEDEAKEIATTLISEGFSNPQLSWHDHYISSAKKLGIAIPDEYYQKVKELKSKNILSTIEYKKKELENLEKQLSAI